MTPGPDARVQLAVLAVTFLGLAAALDSLWAFFAARFSRALRADGRLRNRLTGGALMTARPRPGATAMSLRQAAHSLSVATQGQGLVDITKSRNRCGGSIRSRDC